MPADHKKPVVAYVVLVLLAVAVVFVHFRADALTGRFVALGSLAPGHNEAHGVVELPRSKGQAGDPARRRTPSRDVRRHPIAEERSHGVGHGSDDVRRGRGPVGVGDDVRRGRGSWRSSGRAGTNHEVEHAARVRRFGHRVEQLPDRLAELVRDRGLRGPDTAHASHGLLLGHTVRPDRWRSSRR